MKRQFNPGICLVEFSDIETKTRNESSAEDAVK